MVHFLRVTWLARIGSTWLKAGWLLIFSCVFLFTNTIFLVTAFMPRFFLLRVDFFDLKNRGLTGVATWESIDLLIDSPNQYVEMLI